MDLLRRFDEFNDHVIELFVKSNERLIIATNKIIDYYLIGLSMHAMCVAIRNFHRNFIAHYLLYDDIRVVFAWLL